jgi:hypothetical protein
LNCLNIWNIRIYQSWGILNFRMLQGPVSLIATRRDAS